MDADDVIERLKLQPHPEGGHFRETFRDPVEVKGRSVGTAIYYLLRAEEESRWHKVDSAEIWHHYSGAPLALGIFDEKSPVKNVVLGVDLEAGHVPQFVVPVGHWQKAKSLGDWTLVGCTVSPGFEFSGFELAPEGWEPSL